MKLGDLGVCPRITASVVRFAFVVNSPTRFFTYPREICTDLSCLRLKTPLILQDYGHRQQNCLG
jgi:hypothetical protein